MKFDDASRLYVAHTQVHGEPKAAADLSRQGFKVYLPGYLRRRRHARRVEIVPGPLFPRARLREDVIFAAVAKFAFKMVHSQTPLASSTGFQTMSGNGASRFGPHRAACSSGVR
jgi:hypothetical protein